MERATSATLLLDMPANAARGDYTLRVEGNRERNVIGGSLFLNESALHFDAHSSTILIQTNTFLYNSGDTVRFRVIPLNYALTPYLGTVDVHVLDPDGVINRRWLSRQSNLGAVSLQFPIAGNGKGGLWTIRARAQEQVAEQTFLIEEYCEYEHLGPYTVHLICQCDNLVQKKFTFANCC